VSASIKKRMDARLAFLNAEPSLKPGQKILACATRPDIPYTHGTN